jgi:hypothetical protein
VFEIVKTANGYISTPITLVSFGVGGSRAALIADANGNLFGTTEGDQVHSFGTVFEVMDSGFVVHKFAGTPGKANCYGQSVSALAKQYGGLNNAAAALGFDSVNALQNTIMAFCEG